MELRDRGNVSPRFNLDASLISVERERGEKGAIDMKRLDFTSC